jgi:hypothetical protein
MVDEKSWREENIDSSFLQLFLFAFSLFLLSKNERGIKRK